MGEEAGGRTMGIGGWEAGSEQNVKKKNLNKKTKCKMGEGKIWQKGQNGREENSINNREMKRKLERVRLI